MFYVSRSTISYLSPTELAAAHAAVHNLWNLGAGQRKLVQVVHGWIVQDLEWMGMTHPALDDLDDDVEEYSKGLEIAGTPDRPLGPDLWRDAAAEPEAHGWDPEAGGFAWFEDATGGAGPFDVAKSLSVRPTVGSWDLPAGAGPERVRAWQIRWGAEVDALLQVRKGLGGGGHVDDRLAWFGLRKDVDDLRPLVAEKATWTAKYVNALPDSAFLAVEPGGAKFGGKTVPAGLRHFPVYDKDGKLDLPHLRNALARIPQSKIPPKLKDAALTRARRLAGKAGIEVSKGLEADEDGGVFRLEIAKALDGGAERRIVKGPVLVPDVVDGQGDRISAASIENVAHKFLAEFNKATRLGVQHRWFPSGIQLLESHVLESATTYGERTMPAGTWMMTCKVLDDDLWRKVKSGELTGLSVRGPGHGFHLGREAA